MVLLPTGRRNHGVQSHKGQQPSPSIPAGEAGDGFSLEPEIQEIRNTKTKRCGNEIRTNHSSCFFMGLIKQEMMEKAVQWFPVNSAQHSQTHISILSVTYQAPALETPHCHFSVCHIGHYASQYGTLTHTCCSFVA